MYWSPATGEIDPAALEGATAVFHFAGAGIADKRWTEARKRVLRESRVAGTRLIVDAIHRAISRPTTFICASAIGFYGDRGNEPVDEDSSAGTGFLAELCQEWEAEANRAAIRTINARFGIVLSKRGGALAKMKPAFSLGLGGKLGSGNQMMSWIHLHDAVAALQWAASSKVQGPINLCTPDAVSNQEFTDTLGTALRRPTFVPVPRFALKLAVGAELATEALLQSCNAQPARLAQGGFRWRYPTLATALDEIYAR